MEEGEDRMEDVADVAELRETLEEAAVTAGDDGEAEAGGG